VVVIGETHSFPRPGWAEALIAAHTKPWAVVVPAFANANPDGALSWAAFLRDYGLWGEGQPAREIDRVPPYNTAAKREILLEFGEGLEEAVGQSDVLAVGLRSRGYRSYFEPAATIDHANVSQPQAWLAQRLLAGRAFGAGRSLGWSMFRRLLYVCGGPLIPAVILSRLVRPVRRIRRLQLLPAGTVPALVIGSIVTAIGEVLSYAAGAPPDTLLRCDEYELHKLRYTSLGIP
jgi:hypothetical protein